MAGINVTMYNPNGLTNNPYPGSVSIAPPLGTNLQAPFHYHIRNQPAGLFLNGAIIYDGNLTTVPINGSPTGTGTTTNVYCDVNDSIGHTGTNGPVGVSIYVSPMTVTIPTFSENAVIAGQPYTGAFTAVNGTGPYTFAISGSLPPGITLNPDGTFSGAATATGSFDMGIVTVTDSTSDSGSTFAGEIIVAQAAQAYSQSTRLPGLIEKCLPEGKRMWSTTIDFSAYPIIPLNSVAPYINLPEMVINDNSVNGPGRNAVINGYQVFDIYPGSGASPAGASQAIGLSQVNSLIFCYRPSWGYASAYTQGAADFGIGQFYSLEPLLVTNVTTGQSLIMPWVPYVGNINGNIITNGAMPFYAGPTDHIRIVKVNSNNSSIANGKLTLQFCNFDVSPFLNSPIVTLAT